MRQRLSFAFNSFLWLLLTTASAARADVVTDWNRIALPLVTSYSLAAPAYRDMAMMHLAMYQCINAIEPRHEPYKTKVTASPGTSMNAAAAVAAASLLSKLHPDIAPKIDAELRQYVAKLGERAEAVSAGVALGEKVAAEIWQMRADDGSAAPDTYRPKTTPGQYVPTAPVTSSVWPGVTPFTLKSASQFRPGPPLDLQSSDWVDNYNEIRIIGGKNSKTRTALQTETGRMWLYTGPGTFYPLAQQLSAAKGLDLHENARLFALLGMAATDAMVAVFDAKYRYEFWRPVTAIRNGDSTATRRRHARRTGSRWARPRCTLNILARTASSQALRVRC